MAKDIARKKEAASGGASAQDMPVPSTLASASDSPAGAASGALSADLLDDATLFASLAIDKGSSVPLWIQLRDQIVALISERRLPYGMKMPTVRNLAKDLGVSVSVVNQAYRFLKVTGYLVARQGSGVKVRQRIDNIADEDFPAITQVLDEFVAKCRAFNMTNMDIMDTIRFYLNYQEYVEAEGQPPRTDYYDALVRHGAPTSDSSDSEMEK